MSWTEQQIQTLKKMWGNGFSASDIAKHLGGGLTRNAVIGKAHRLKLSSRPAVAKPEDGHLAANGISSVGVSINRVSTKKRAMLRPLPPVQTPVRTMAQSTIRESWRPIESVVKRTEGIAVTKAGERHCRWPIGDPRSPDFRFCGCSAHEGLPYCIDHARVAYQTVSKRSRASDDTVSQDFRLPNAATRY